MADTRQAARPLSPHLQIYRFTITMAMSIIHRFTGIALYAGTLLIAAWLLAVATGPDTYAFFQTIAGSWFGKFVLFAYTWTLLHHLMSGLRYLVWDNARAFDLKSADFMSWGAAVMGFVLTVLVWIVAYEIKGAL